MKQKSYFEQREISCLQKIDVILEQLPYYVQDFFGGVELRTSPLSRLNYAYDLRVFFDFLTKRFLEAKKLLISNYLT